ncbi:MULTISPECIES: hypothetical protein [unclassified Pedobacter]|uniref:hypothetical protein n=1 Tax=unclassified Pedobacter TaxID=2628915 RepID=UPI00141F6814|nr:MULTISPECIES: hypothetical protein [unclassified Pedobacter]NII81693.1 hypothetical protein [Pedobacter sp. SG908]NMN35697.1 hypothetical protein [Pedobacter sp. SG918]
MKKKIDLSSLPMHIIKKNAKWFQNSKTGEWISAEKISDHLPMSAPKAEAILAKRWDLNY